MHVNQTVVFLQLFLVISEKCQNMFFYAMEGYGDVL